MAMQCDNDCIGDHVLLIRHVLLGKHLVHFCCFRIDERFRGIVKLPEDLGIKRSEAKRSLLAAQTIDDLIEWSDGLYEPPMKFRTWS